MLIQPLIQQLQELRLRGMAAALEHQLATPDRAHLSFEERLGLMISTRSPSAASRLCEEIVRFCQIYANTHKLHGPASLRRPVDDTFCLTPRCRSGEEESIPLPSAFGEIQLQKRQGTASAVPCLVAGGSRKRLHEPRDLGQG